MHPTASVTAQLRKNGSRRRKLPPSFSAQVADSEDNSLTSQPRVILPDEREDLRVKIKAQLNGKEPREFQIEMVVAQEERRDAMCHAATGLGKTLIAAAPFTLERNKMRVTIMVSPLVALQDEMVGVHSIVLIPLVIEICLTQVESFKNEYGIYSCRNQ